MSFKEKINQAKPSDWLADGIPKWKVKLIILTAKLKARIYMKVKGT